MILGVAQVVVNVPDLRPPMGALLAAGYSESFAERAIPNHPAKRPLQAHPRECLDMVHLTAPASGVAVELTAYAGERPAGRAAYRLELPGNGDGLRSVSDDVRPPGEPARVTVPAANLDGSRRFWRDLLGLRETGDDRCLTFAAIRPEWTLDVILADDEANAGTSVDAAGCVLVTFLTTGLETDLAELAEDVLVLRSTPPWEESIGGRVLRVAMVEGPSGELVELIELPRPS